MKSYMQWKNIEKRLAGFQSHRIHGTGIFTYIYHKNQPNVGKYTIHGSYGNGLSEGSLFLVGSVDVGSI